MTLSSSVIIAHERLLVVLVGFVHWVSWGKDSKISVRKVKFWRVPLGTSPVTADGQDWTEEEGELLGACNRDLNQSHRSSGTGMALL